MNNKLRSKFYGMYFFSIIVGVFFLLTTCKIGLGESVDIYPPNNVEITYPAAASRIRGNFIITGTADDDFGVKEIKVLLKNTSQVADTSEKQIPANKVKYNASTKQWIATVENNYLGEDSDHPLIKKYTYPDGTYTVSIIAYDERGDSTRYDTTYEIDNTPPVLILDRPTTGIKEAMTSSNNIVFDNYGAEFVVKGEAGDTHNIASLKVVAGESKTVLEAQNPTKSINIPDLAVFENPTTGTQYEEILKSEANKVRQAVFYIYDDAEEYSSGGRSTGTPLGNQSEFFYVRTSMGDITSGEKGYTAEVIADYFAGFLGSNAATASTREKNLYRLRNEDSATRDKLASSRIKTELLTDTITAADLYKHGSALFSLDPNRNPTVDIAGIVPVTTADIDSSTALKEIAQKQTAVITLTPNKSKKSLLDSNNEANVHLVLVRNKKSDASIENISGFRESEQSKWSYTYLKSFNSRIKNAVFKDGTALRQNADDKKTVMTKSTMLSQGGGITAKIFLDIDVGAYKLLVVRGEENGTTVTFDVDNFKPATDSSDEFDYRPVLNDKVMARDNGHLIFKVTGTGNPPTFDIKTFGEQQNIQNNSFTQPVYLGKDATLALKINITADNSPKLEIKYKKKADTAWALKTPTGSTSGGVWNYTGSLDYLNTDNYEIAEYQIKFTATDSTSGKATTTPPYSVIYDLKEPDLVITNPKTDDTYVIDNKLILAGNITEENSGVKSIQIGIPNLPSISVGAYYNFSKTIDVSSLSENTKHTATIIVTDKAGNKVTKTRTFYVDKFLPTATIEITKDSAGKAPKTLDSIASYDKVPTVTINATDNSGIKEGTKLVVKKDNAVLETYTNLNARPFKTDLTVPSLTDGKYDFELTVVDKAGRISTVEKTIKIDTTKPTLTPIVPIADGIVTTNTPTLKGTVSDNGVGVEKVEYSFNNSVWTAATLAGDNWTAENVDIGAVGEKNLYLRATDKVGNVKESGKITYFYDKDKPKITETSTKPSYLNASNNATGHEYKGKVSDDWKLADSDSLVVTIAQTGGSTSTKTISLTGSGTGTTASPKDWSYTFQGQADGEYTLTFTVKDGANQTATLSHTIVVDTVEPAFGTNADAPKISSPSTDISGTKWYNTSVLSIAGKASDDTSHIKIVEYGIGASPTTWKPLLGTTSWSGTLQNIKDNDVIKVRLTDNAGNEKTHDFSAVRLDLTVPELSVTAPTGTALVNKKANLIVKGTVNDTGSGVEKVLLKINDKVFTNGAFEATIATGGTWEISIPMANLKDGPVYVKAVDKVENSVIIPSFTIQVDATDPSVDFTGPVANATVNKEITVTGTASDDQGLEKIEIYRKTGAGSTDWAKLTETVNGTNNWSVEIDTETSTNFINYDSNSSKDGSQVTLKVVATDKAQNTVEKTHEITVDQDSDRPIITLNNVNLDNMTDSQPVTLGNAEKKLTGNISDDDGLIKKLEVSSDAITIEDDAAIWKLVETTSGNFSYTFDSEGKKTLRFKITDAKDGVFYSQKLTTSGTAFPQSPKLIDTATTAHKFGYNDNDSPNKGSMLVVYVDTSNPGITETEVASDGKAFNKTFTISGIADDTNGVDKVTITTGSGANLKTWTATLTDNSATTSSTTDKTWTQEIGVGTGANQVNDGQHKFDITVTDNAGKTTKITRSVIVDTTKPTLSNVKLAGDVNKYIKKELGGKISGNAADTNGIKSIQYKIQNSNDTAPTAIGPTWTTAIGTTTWQIDIAGQNEGKYKAYIVAQDTAGNFSAISDNVVEFTVDASEPTATITVGQATGNNVNETGGSTKLRGAEFILSGSALDTYYKEATFTATKDGTEINPLTGFTRQQSGTWLYTQAVNTNGSDDGLYVYTLTVEDNAGRTTSATQTVRIDTKNPELEIISPSDNEGVDTSTKLIRGTVADSSGIESLTYSLKQGTTPLQNNVMLTPNGESWTAGDVSLGANEGELVLTVTATDKLGKVTTKTRTFFYDKKPPTLTERGIGASGKITREKFTLSGTAEDSNGIKSLTITTGSGTTKRDWTVTPSGNNWTQEIEVGTGINQVNDGTHVFTIEAKDKANKTTTVQRTVTLDRQAPEFGTASDEKPRVTTTAIDVSGTNWYKDSIIEVKATVTDALSGVSTMEWSTNKTSGNWTSMTKGSDNEWSANVPVKDGTNSIDFKAVDLAGNEVITSVSVVAKVDLLSPASLTTHQVDGQTGITNKLSNGSAFNVSFTNITDATGGSGVKNIRLAKIGTKTYSDTDAPPVIVSAGTATVQITETQLATASNGAVVFLVTDNVGNAQEFTSFSLEKDTTAPTVTITEPANNATVNKTIELRGTATDNQSLQEVKIQRNNSGTWQDLATATGTYSWKYNLNTEDYDDADGTGTLQLRAVAYDRAGNEKESTELTLNIDQDSDRPIIKFTNLNLAGMSSTNPVWLKNTRDLYGSIQDDDGLATSNALQVSTDGVAYNTANLSLAGSTFTYKFPQDGATRLYFKVTDAKGGVFTSQALGVGTPSLTAPKLTDFASTPNTIGYKTSTEKGSSLNMNIDTEAPTIDEKIYIDVTPATQSAPNNFDDTTSTANEFKSNMVLGGSKKTFALQINAKDANGIKDVVVMQGSTEYTTAKKGNSATNAEQTFVSETIDTSSFANESLTIEVIVTDMAGVKATASRTVLIDNQEPTVAVESPAQSEQVTGRVVMRGTTGDGNNGSGVESIKYVIAKTAPAVDSTDWKGVTSGKEAWKIDFDGETNGLILKEYANNTYASETISGISNIWKIPVLFRIEDKAGNVKTTTATDHFILYDPDGDKPKINVLGPKPQGTGDLILGGSIRIYGTAEDNESVKSTWIQIDVNGDGNFDDTDKTLLEKMKSQPISSATPVTYSVATPTSNDTSWTWGIKMDGTVSWNMTLNANGEFDPINPGEQKEIRYRVRAIDRDNDVSSWSDTILIKVDKTAPKIGQTNELTLVQYSDNVAGTGNITASQKYESDMWIKGKWWLTGSIEDESGIHSVNIGGDITADISTEVSPSGTKYFTEKSYTAPYEGFNMNIPIEETSGKITFVIDVQDKSEPAQTIKQTISINRDNTAPTVTAPLQSKGSDVNDTTNTVKQSDDAYTFSSVAVETGSGLKGVVFWFERGTGATAKLYNIMESASNTTQTNALTTLDGMFVKTYTVTRNNATTATFTDVATNKNIRKGGLIKIGGVYRRILGVDRGNNTITFDGAVTTTVTTLYVVYGFVVDNQRTETKRTNGIIDNDDGDGMVESIEKSGGTYKWAASIDSKNIVDGPIKIHYVAIDNAGNVTAVQTVESKVENNPPKIGKITLGTDFDGNGTVDSDEKVEYTTLDSSGKKKQEVNLPFDETKNFTAKAKTEVLFDIVGGNGNLYYGYEVTGSSSATQNVVASGTGATTLRTSSSGAVNPIVLAVDSSSKLIGLDDNDSIGHEFNFTIWDSTEGFTAGTDTQKATAKIVIKVDSVDEVPPMSVISPFKWTSKTDNSLYENKAENGHIELEADLPTTFTAGGTGVNDRDPKVSGKISIRGTAYDDQRLTEIWAKIDNFTFAGTGLTTRSIGTNTGMVRLAQYTNGTWNLASSGGNMAQNGWHFAVTDKEIKQDGHRIEWQLDWDSSRVAGVAGLDKNITIITKDRSTNGYSSATVAGTNADEKTHNKPTYKVDIVPYISKVETGLSKASALRPSIVNRTALGEYPVARVRSGSTWDTETITVRGFNLNPTATNQFIFTGTKDIVQSNGSLITGANYVSNTNVLSVSGEYVINLTGITSSGYLSYISQYQTGAGARYVYTLNNLNKNDTAGKSNMEPNDRNNNILTDDRFIRVIDVTTVNTQGEIRKLDFATHGTNLNFSAGYIDNKFAIFQNVTGSLARASKLRSSYTRYFDNCIAYNDSGTSFTLSACGDTLGVPVTSFSNGPSKFALIRGYRNEQAEYGSEDDSTVFLESNYNGSALNNLNRFILPDMVVKGHDSNSKGYISYYDSTQKLVKFRYFETGTSANITTGYQQRAKFNAQTTLYNHGSSNNHIEQTVPQYTVGGKSYYQGFVAIAGGDSNSRYAAVNVLSNGTAIVVWYDAFAGALKMKYNTTPATSFSGYQAFRMTPSQGTTTFNISVDGQISRNVSVTARQISGFGDFAHEFAYQLNKVLSENGYGAFAEYDMGLRQVVVRSMQTGTGSSIAITNLNTGAVSQAVAGNGNAWVERIIDANQAGRDPSIAVDSKNGIHIAYYATGAGDLRYAYLPSVNGAINTVTVDSYQQVGRYTDIAIKEEAGYIVPYISYYTMSLADTKYAAKLAILKEKVIPVNGNSTFTSAMHGARDELFTGIWEVMHIPSHNIPEQYKINVEVDSAGKVYMAYQADQIEYIEFN